MKRPDFLIPGAQKCGTTTLYYLLRQHPQCYMPEEKEPQALASVDYSPTDYAALFAPAVDGGHRVAGEASTSYFVIPGIPERISSECSGAVRFVVILRDPAKRTLSSFLHMYKRGHERRDWNQLFGQLGCSEEEALAAERIEAEAAELNCQLESAPYREQYGEQRLWNFLYLYGSFYSHHLQRYFRCFDREKFHVMFLENFQRNPQAEMTSVFQFLGLDSSFVPQGLDTVFNRTEIEPVVTSQGDGLLVHCQGERRTVVGLREEVRAGLDLFFLNERRRVAELAGPTPPAWS